jgi:hypothetical protein
MMSETNILLKQPIVRGDDRHPALALSDIANPRGIRSMELHVFLQDAALPTRGEWQTAINEQGFCLTLNEALDVRHHTGLSTALYWGRRSGFEFSLCPAVDVALSCMEISARIGARDLSANFRWRGNALESVVVYIASAALARLANGIVYLPQKNRFSTGREAVAMARRLMEVTELS